MPHARFLNLLFAVSALALLAGAILFETKWEYAPYLFAGGAAGLSVARLAARYTGKSPRIRRLHRMETVSALLTLAASYLMFRNENEWFLLLSVAALLQLYTAFVLPMAERKEQEGA